MRNRGWRRKKDFSKAKRKRNIDFHDIYWLNYKKSNNVLNFLSEVGIYHNLHQYSKNKIHCSCGMCSAKTRNKGNRRKLSGNYSPSINYTIKDQKRKDEMDYEEKWD